MKALTPELYEILEESNSEEGTWVYEVQKSMEIHFSVAHDRLKKLESLGYIEAKKTGKKVVYKTTESGKEILKNSSIINNQDFQPVPYWVKGPVRLINIGQGVLEYAIVHGTSTITSGIISGNSWGVQLYPEGGTVAPYLRASNGTPISHVGTMFS